MIQEMDESYEWAPSSTTFGEELLFLIKSSYPKKTAPFSSIGKRGCAVYTSPSHLASCAVVKVTAMAIAVGKAKATNVHFALFVSL